MKQNMFLGQDDKKIKQVYAYIYAKKLTLLLFFFFTSMFIWHKFVKNCLQYM